MADSPAHHLIVGLPALLARLVLEQVACFEPQARLWLLIAPGERDAVEQQLAQLGPAIRGRSRLAIGDLTRIDLGLSGREYGELCEQVERVYYVPPALSPLVDRELADRIGTARGRELLELARAAKNLKALTYFSSARVTRRRSAPFREDEPPDQRYYSDGPERAIVLAERIALRALPNLPLVLLRTPELAGDSQTGETEHDSRLARLINDCLALTGPAHLPSNLKQTPVHLVASDFVARAGYFASRQKAALGQTLLLSTTHPMSTEHFARKLLEACGMELSLVDGARRLTVDGEQGRFRKSLQDVVGPGAQYDATNAAALLKDSSIECPNFEEYAPALVDFARSRAST